MLLMPKRIKFSKDFSARKKMKKTSKNDQFIRFSNLCLIANQSGMITSFHLESIRRFLRRSLKKKAQLFFRFFPDTPITKKPNEVRLGRGKANSIFWAYFVKKGEVILELNSAKPNIILSSLTAARIKLPIKSFFFSRKLRWIL
jgi:large subunit ribosomal protein L16